LQDLLPMPALAVGAAFPFIGGTIPQAPRWIQDIGMEWFFRLCMEPRRLWRRYAYLNPAYVAMLMMQLLGLRSYATTGSRPPQDLMYG
ncbi:MAG: WecB/TagA/CpsF family glycosyltransferase, partial [Acidobacteriales bacterium]|nr:WecB/TagA/CpsF family glycosyltransferase [Terriglobales bacterium]